MPTQADTRGAQPGCAWERGLNQAACAAGALSVVTEVPLRAPPPSTLSRCSLGTTGGFWPSEALRSLAAFTPQTPGLLHQRPPGWNKGNAGRTASPSCPLAHLAEAGRRSAGSPR